MTQTQLILDHLRTRGPITPLEALREYGCFRLGARIYDLKQQGHAIRTDMVQTSGGKKVASYALRSA